MRQTTENRQQTTDNTSAMRRKALALTTLILPIIMAVGIALAGSVTVSAGPAPTPDLQKTNGPTNAAPTAAASTPANPPPASQSSSCANDVASSSAVGFGGTLNCYVSNLYTWAIGAGAGLAVIILMYAGYLMITSSGDPQKVGFAKEIIVGSLSGLALLAAARLILNVLSIG